MKPLIETSLVVSSAHLPISERDALWDGDWLHIPLWDEYQVILSVDEWTLEESNKHHPDLVHVNQLLRIALDLHCDWLHIDRDGPIYDTLNGVELEEFA